MHGVNLHKLDFKFLFTFPWVERERCTNRTSELARSSNEWFVILTQYNKVQFCWNSVEFIFSQMLDKVCSRMQGYHFGAITQRRYKDRGYNVPHPNYKHNYTDNRLSPASDNSGNISTVC